MPLFTHEPWGMSRNSDQANIEEELAHTCSKHQEIVGILTCSRVPEIGCVENQQVYAGPTENKLETLRFRLSARFGVNAAIVWVSQEERQHYRVGRLDTSPVLTFYISRLFLFNLRTFK